MKINGFQSFNEACEPEEEPFQYSQQENFENPGIKLTNREAGKATRDSLPYIKDKLLLFQSNSHPLNDYYHSMSAKHFDALATYLFQNPDGKVAFRASNDLIIKELHWKFIS